MLQLVFSATTDSTIERFCLDASKLFTLFNLHPIWIPFSCACRPKSTRVTTNCEIISSKPKRKPQASCRQLIIWICTTWLRVSALTCGCVLKKLNFWKVPGCSRSFVGLYWDESIKGFARFGLGSPDRPCGRLRFRVCAIGRGKYRSFSFSSVCRSILRFHFRPPPATVCGTGGNCPSFRRW